MPCYYLYLYTNCGNFFFFSLACFINWQFKENICENPWVQWNYLKICNTHKSLGKMQREKTSSFQFTGNAVETKLWLAVWLEPHITGMKMAFKISIFSISHLFFLPSPPMNFVSLYCTNLCNKSPSLNKFCLVSQGGAGIEDKHVAEAVKRCCSLKQVASSECCVSIMETVTLCAKIFSVCTVKKNLTFMVRWHYSGMAQ